MGTTFDPQTGFVNYRADEGGVAGRKAPAVDLGMQSPGPRRYYDREEARLEWDRMWMKCWAFASLVQDLPKIGDYFRHDLGKESFIVVRIASGDEGIKIYYNVCPHRGNRLVRSDFGHVDPKQGFQCDFHGWKFSTARRNIEIRDECIFRPQVGPSGFDRDQLRRQEQPDLRQPGSEARERSARALGRHTGPLSAARERMPIRSRWHRAQAPSKRMLTACI